ncbi:MAG: GNAT family N-acetyltransferase [Legionellaceae bacterium]|nr:GNAT family N-acetyltransferase [Legionellaceae bacterium]
MTDFLKTRRLTLRLTEPSDFEHILRLRADPDVQRFTTQGAQSRQDIERLMDTILAYKKKHGHGMVSVFLRDSGEFIGQAAIFHSDYYDLQPEIEICYRFHKAHWGKGYATEVTKALLDWGFKNLDIDTIVSFIVPENIASKRVLEKCGFQCIGLAQCAYGLLERYEAKRTANKAWGCHLGGENEW